MFDRILRQLRELVRTSQYVMTLHAEEEMEAVVAKLGPTGKAVVLTVFLR